MANEIRILPNDVRSVIRSGIGLTTFSECVTELVYNSIDALSSCIAIRIDANKYGLQIIDNGAGFSSQGLRTAGNRYMTNKLKDMKDLWCPPHSFGYRGEALSNIVNLSKNVIITSRQDHSNTFQKIFHEGFPLDVIEVKHRPCKGTTVIATGLFYQMPVRQRNMNSIVDMEEITTNIKNIALIHPKISISLHEISNNTLLFGVKLSSIIPEKYDLIFDPNPQIFLSLITYELENITAKAFIGTDLTKYKKHQFIYINNRPINCKKLHNMLSKGLVKILLEHRKENMGPEMIDKELEQRDLLRFSPVDYFATNCVYIVNFICPIYKYISQIDQRSNELNIEINDILLRVTEGIIKKFMDKHPCTATTNVENLVSGKGTVKIDNEVDDDPHFDLFIKAVRGKYATRMDKNTNSNADINSHTITNLERTHSGNVSNLCVSVFNETEIPSIPKMTTSDSINMCRTQLQSDKDLFASYSANLRLLKLNSQVDEIKQKYSKRDCATITSSQYAKLRKIEIRRRTINLRTSGSGSRYKAYSNHSDMVKTYQTRDEQRGVNTKSMDKFINRNPIECQSTCNHCQENISSMRQETNELRYKINCLYDAYMRLVANVSHGGHFNPEDPLHEITASGTANNFDFVYPMRPMHSEIANEDLTGDKSVVSQSSNHFMRGSPNDYYEFDSAIFEPIIDITEGLPIAPFQLENPSEVFGNFSNDIPLETVVDKYLNKTNTDKQIATISEAENQSVINVDCKASIADALPTETGADKQIIHNGNIWMEQIDSSGQLFFINPETGCSYYEVQKLKDTKSFLMKNRFVFLPKGVSPIVDDMAEVNNAMDNNTMQNKIVLKSDADVDSGINKIFDNMETAAAEKNLLDYYETEITAADNNGLMNFRSHRVLQQVTFNHNIFKKLQILGQLDNKFIVCLLNDGVKMASNNDQDMKMLVLFDQHAVHERIRLEKLLNEYTYNDERDSLLSHKLDEDLKFGLTDMNLFTLKQCPSNFIKSGFKWDLDEKEKVATFHHVPICLYKKFQDKDNNNIMELLSSVLWDQYNVILTMKGINCGILKSLMDVINTEACRGAIKFGDAISMDKCLELMSDLSACQTPFICAHGRPNVVALADIGRTPPDVISKPRLERLHSVGNGE